MMPCVGVSFTFRHGLHVASLWILSLLVLRGSATAELLTIEATGSLEEIQVHPSSRLIRKEKRRGVAVLSGAAPPLPKPKDHPDHKARAQMPKADTSDDSAKGSTNFKSFCEGDGFTHEWADEFNGADLDTNVWRVIDSDGRATGPQTSVVAPLGVVACRTARCRKDNVRVKDGKLHLLSERSASNASNSTEFFTGAVTTKGQKTWEDSPAYRMCISAKLPGSPGAAGKGIWPAHWMLPDNGYSQSCLDEGEMDIMEMVNSEGRSYSTFHWMSSYPKKKCADFVTFHKSVHSLTKLPASWNSDFHEYAVERSPHHIAFAVDGKVVQNISASKIGTELSHTPFFLILNTAIGGAWPGEPNKQTQLPVEHVIDYVRLTRQRLAAFAPASGATPLL